MIILSLMAMQKVLEVIDDFGCRGRVVVIAFHGIVTSVAHFTLYAYRTFFSRFRIDHAD